MMDVRTISPSDYTVMVTGLPMDANEEEVRTFMTQFGRADDKPAEVVRVTFACKIKDFVDCIQEVEKINAKLRELESRPDSCCCNRSLKIDTLRRKTQLLNAHIQEQETKMRQAGVLFTGTAFVTFRTQADARAVVARFGASIVSWYFRALISHCFRRCLPDYSFRSHYIQAVLAPEPSDVIWENLDAPYSARLKKSSSAKRPLLRIRSIRRCRLIASKTSLGRR